MARHGETHWDVAAYALGVLDPVDVPRCEAHLAECASCAAELETLLPTSWLLADVDAESLRAEQPPFVDRLLESVRTERHRLRIRRRLTAGVGAAAAAVVAGFSLFAGSTWLAAAPEPEPGQPAATATPALEPPGVGGPDLGDGEVFTAVDPDTGVRADVLLDELDWGTQVWLALSAVHGPLEECRLLLVYADGHTEAAGSWRVPDEGYGTSARPDPLQLPASTATGPGELAELRVVSVDAGDGTESPLVTVPF